MRLLLLIALCFAGAQGAHAAPEKRLIEIAYLTRTYPEPLPLSLVEPVVTDSGIQGARLAIKDNLTTGRFLGHDYKLIETTAATDRQSLLDAARKLFADGHKLIVADLEPEDLIAVADLPEAGDAILLNIRSSDDALRGADCRRNVFHVAPSYAMRADALGQYLVWKKWRKWLVLIGDQPSNQGYAAAIRRTAARYGAKIVEERKLHFDPGNRRSETGHQQIQTQIPMLTQEAPEHDVVFVADNDETFGEYLMWRTSAAKPVVGTQGLVAVAWHRSFEQYGGVQLQNRFQDFAHRIMTERDYLAWLAARIFGEAVTRSNKTAVPDLRTFLVTKFTIAAFKGQALSFRTWDRQLRQPILLSGPRALVSMSPQDGYLHEKFITDTLGFDQPETQCKLPDQQGQTQ
jgi:ABC transporter substrate binding protein (PQQ-dependent alcohol dehydrogenase system)